MRIACVALLLFPMAVLSAAGPSRVQLAVNEAGRRVDVTIDGKPFTSYIWPTTLKKPTLYPIRTARGTVVTRGFPLDPRKGERVDHPHHVGLWLNHGDVNGLDFWNNSDAIPAEQAPKMGTILHRRIVEAKGGGDRGELRSRPSGSTPDKKPLLRERTRFIFRGDADVTHHRPDHNADRARSARRLPRHQGRIPRHAGGARPRAARRQARSVHGRVGQSDSRPGSRQHRASPGKYISSEGLKGDAVWGTRGRWTMLRGAVDAEPVTARDSRPSVEPRLPDLLARARLRFVRRQSARPERFHDGKESASISRSSRANPSRSSTAC